MLTVDIPSQQEGRRVIVPLPEYLPTPPDKLYIILLQFAHVPEEATIYGLGKTEGGSIPLQS